MRVGGGMGGSFVVRDEGIFPERSGGKIPTACTTKEVSYCTRRRGGYFRTHPCGGGWVCRAFYVVLYTRPFSRTGVSVGKVENVTEAHREKRGAVSERSE